MRSFHEWVKFRENINPSVGSPEAGRMAERGPLFQAFEKLQSMAGKMPGAEPLLQAVSDIIHNTSKKIPQMIVSAIMNGDIIELKKAYSKFRSPRELDDEGQTTPGGEFSINDWLESMKDQKVFTKYPRIQCKDGFSMSVRADHGAYCEPREDEGPYEKLEIGYPSHMEKLLMPYKEGKKDNPTSSVYGYVPVEVINQVVKKHGGLRD